MPAPTTVETFFQLVEQSGLTAIDRIAPYRQAATGKAMKPEEMAKRLVKDGVLTAFQIRFLLQGKHRGLIIGKYKVLDQIGSGATGLVYLCEHVVMRRRVAIKVLPRDLAANPESLERFYREGRAAASLDHPNIVHAYDIEKHGEMHFLVMEYVEGRSLYNLVLKEGPLSIEHSVNFLAQAATGLQHAFLTGLVHRDIKPANLLIEANTGVIKILDMGLARFFHDDSDDLTKRMGPTAVLGTADYIAPEQAISSRAADIRSDLYSLGATAYYLLTGEPPFPSGSAPQKLIWHQTKVPPSLRERRPEIPEELDAVVAKMLSKKPPDRFQTPAEVIEALSPWIVADLPLLDAPAKATKEEQDSHSDSTVRDTIRMGGGETDTDMKQARRGLGSTSDGAWYSKVSMPFKRAVVWVRSLVGRNK